MKTITSKKDQKLMASAAKNVLNMSTHQRVVVKDSTITHSGTRTRINLSESDRGLMTSLIK